MIKPKTLALVCAYTTLVILLMIYIIISGDITVTLDTFGIQVNDWEGLFTGMVLLVISWCLFEEEYHRGFADGVEEAKKLISDISEQDKK